MMKDLPKTGEQKFQHKSEVIKYYKKISDFFLGDFKNSNFIVFIIYLFTVSILEIIAHLNHGAFSIIASRIWIIGGAVCIITIFYYLIDAFKKDITTKNYITAVSLIFLIIALLSVLGKVNITEINPDATQQMAAGIDSFKEADWNYTGKAFLGYPNRQYILGAIPAAILGRSIFTLQLGFAYPFLLGLICMYFGVRKWAETFGGDIKLSIIPIFSIVTFPFITEYYLNFEQAIFPVSFTMIILGLFLIFICKPNLLSLFAISWFGSLLSNCYTPALASLGLLVIFLIVTSYMFYKKSDYLPSKAINSLKISKLLGVTVFNIIIFLFATLLSQRQDRITQTRQDADVISTAYNSIYSFVTDKDAVFMGMFGIVILIYLIAGLSLRLKSKDFIVSIWALGVFVATYLLKGYTSYQPAWIMQRALIVIPVLLIGIIIYLIDWTKMNNIRIKTDFFVIIIIACVIIANSNTQRVNQSFTYFNSIQPMKFMLSDLEMTIEKMSITTQEPFNLIVFTNDILRKNPGDYCKFLHPNAKVFVPENKILPKEIDTSKITIIYSDDNIPGLTNRTELIQIAFENQKHKSTVTLYKGVIK